MTIDRERNDLLWGLFIGAMVVLWWSRRRCMACAGLTAGAGATSGATICQCAGAGGTSTRGCPSPSPGFGNYAQGGGPTVSVIGVTNGQAHMVEVPAGWMLQ